MKNRSIQIVLSGFLLIGLLLTGCASQSANMDKASSNDSYAPSEPSTDVQGEAEGATLNLPDENPADRKIIYTASMRFRCDDPGEALRLFTAKAEELGGYVAGSTASTGDGDRIEDAQLILRLPAGTLETVRDYAYELGTVQYFNMNSDDITDDYYDLDARLTQAKEREAQVLTFMDQAKSIEETLAVYKELSDIRAEIEVMEGRQRMWDKQVAYSTLTINITAIPAYVDSSPEFLRPITMSETWQKARNGFINVAIGTGNFFKGLFIAIVWLLIPAAIAGGIVLLIIYLVRRNRSKRPPKAKMPPYPPVGPPAPPAPPRT